jgi:hypothetical protein
LRARFCWADTQWRLVIDEALESWIETKQVGRGPLIYECDLSAVRRTCRSSACPRMPCGVQARHVDEVMTWKSGQDAEDLFNE